MTEMTAKYAGQPFKSFSGIDFFEDVVDRRIVHEGDVLTVGDKHIEVWEIADHAPGSAMFLVREDRLLLTGDEIFGFPKKMLKGSLQDWCRNMKKLASLLDRVDLIYGGNGKLEKEYVRNFIRCSEYAFSHQEEAEYLPADDGMKNSGPERSACSVCPTGRMNGSLRRMPTQRARDWTDSPYSARITVLPDRSMIPGAASALAFLDRKMPTPVAGMRNRRCR